MADLTMWIEYEGEHREINALNWHIWKRRGAKAVRVPKAAEPKHVGGGVYEMPDGSRVRGKEAAGLE